MRDEIVKELKFLKNGLSWKKPLGREILNYFIIFKIYLRFKILIYLFGKMFPKILYFAFQLIRIL